MKIHSPGYLTTSNYKDYESNCMDIRVVHYPGLVNLGGEFGGLGLFLTHISLNHMPCMPHQSPVYHFMFTCHDDLNTIVGIKWTVFMLYLVTYNCWRCLYVFLNYCWSVGKNVICAIVIWGIINSTLRRSVPHTDCI